MIHIKRVIHFSLLLISLCFQTLLAQDSDNTHGIMTSIKTNFNSTDSLMFGLPGGYLKIHSDSVQQNQNLIDLIESGQTVSAEKESTNNHFSKEPPLQSAEKPSTEWHADPGVSRYFYAPSALLPEKGQLTLSQKELIFTSISYGVTDHVAIVGGAVVPAWFPGFYHGIFGVKAGYDFSEKIHVAGGFETMAGGADGEFGSFTLPFATFTYGDNYANATLNVGKPFAWMPTNEDNFDSAPFLLISPSAYYRINEKFAVLSENWFFINQGGTGNDVFGDDEVHSAYSALVRFVSERITGDLGLMFVPGVEFPLPLLSFSYSW